MKIEYNNLYTHFVFTTLHHLPVIPEKHRIKIEKYITGFTSFKPIDPTWNWPIKPWGWRNNRLGILRGI